MKSILFMSAALAAMLVMPVYADEAPNAPSELGITFDTSLNDQADVAAADTTEMAAEDNGVQATEEASEQPQDMAETDADTASADPQTEQAALEASEQLAANSVEESALPFDDTVTPGDTAAESEAESTHQP